MSGALSTVSIKDVPAIVEADPIKISWQGRFTLWVLLVLGVVVFVTVLGTEPERAWTAFQVNFLYWVTISAAATVFASIFHICNAQWARPIVRIFSAGSNFLLGAAIPLMIVFVYGAKYIFVWYHEEIPGKGVWLNPNFVYMRDALALILLGFVARRVIYYSIRRDIGAVRSGLTGVEGAGKARWSDKSYDHFVAGWGSDPRAEIRKSTERMGRLSPIVIILYSAVISIIAFDQEMSVDPHWYSTLFGGFIFMGAIYGAVAWTSMSVGMARELHPLFLQKIDRKTLHDLGKLLFGFGIFWAYLFWSHYLPIWYGNMPEETEYIILRLRELPWRNLAWMVLGCCFIVPFLLGLSRDVKQMPLLLFVTGSIVAFGLWIQHYLLFAPTIFKDVIPLSIAEVFISFGFMAAFLLSGIRFLERYPLIPFGDFYLKSEHDAAPAHSHTEKAAA